MASVSELLAANLHDVFGNRDPITRRQAIERVYSDDVAFTDPDGTVRGRSAVEAKAAALLAGAPSDSVFVEDGNRYVGTDIGVLAWAFGPMGAPVVRGIDVITVVDGLITSVRTLLSDVVK